MASECDLDASLRSRLHLNMRPISITIDHSVTNVQQTKLSAEAGVAMLNVLHIGKGASHWNGNWGGGLPGRKVYCSLHLLFLWSLHTHSILQPSDPP